MLLPASEIGFTYSTRGADGYTLNDTAGKSAPIIVRRRTLPECACESISDAPEISGVTALLHSFFSEPANADIDKTAFNEL